MSQDPQKYIKDKNLSNNVARTKVSHGRIETAVRVRNAQTKEEIDLELRRLKVLNQIDKSSIAKTFSLPSSIKRYQQLILIIGTLSLKSTQEISLACKKLGYSGKSDRKRIHTFIGDKLYRDFFKFDKDKGWLLTNKGQNEFFRLKQFI